jgi:hypothetical protein
MRNYRVANDVFLVELDHTNFGKLAKAVNGIDEPILAAEHFQVRLLGVANKADFGVLAHAGETGFDVTREEILRLINDNECLIQGSSPDVL